MDARRKALIVANDRYEHEGLGRLGSPAADADALGGVLADPQIGGFEVRVVHNEPAHVIGTYIEDLFSDSRPDDVLLLHFSCHGLKSESGELYFAAPNTRPNRLASTAVSADFVQRCMRSSRARSIVLLLDCCYGGAFGQGVAVRASGTTNVFDSFPAGRLGGGRGRAVITASSSMEYAFEGDRLADATGPRPSVFTSALVEGLATGEADRDEDGWISLNELYDYVFDRVREQNPNQTPSRDVEMQGELYLARSRRRRVRPQPIPADLRAAMTDANMFSRLGAVTELRSRLVSDNLPVAAGALQALRDIANADIRYVADAARAALDEAEIRPTERELRFEAPTVGADPGVRMVRLLGPALARACTVRAAEPWIRAVDTTEGIAVSVDTSHAGDRHGTLTVQGPTGELAIPVTLHVTAPPAPPSDVRPAAPIDGPSVSRAGAPSAAPAGAPVPPTGTATRDTATTDTPTTDTPTTDTPTTDTPTTDAARVEAAPAGSPSPTPAGSPAPVAADRRSRRAARVAIVMLVGGGLTILLGGVLPVVASDPGKITTIETQLAVYAAVWAFLAGTPGEAGWPRRIALAVLAAWALVVLVVLAAVQPLYLAYWEIPETPLYRFWLVAGLLELAAAALGGARPTRLLELISGGLTTAFGALVLYLVDRAADRPWLVASLSSYLAALGITWLLIGARRRTRRTS